MEWLAEIRLEWVLIVVGILGAALLFLRLYPGKDSARARGMAENVQIALSVVIAVFLVIRPFIFQAFFIPSGSMEPTLHGPAGEPGSHSSSGAGDRILANKLLYFVSDPKHDDIAVFKAPKKASPDEKDFIKRVIGVPGDTVEVVPSKILANGKVAFAPTESHRVAEGTELSKVDPTPVKEIEFTQFGTALKLMAAPGATVKVTPHEVTVDGKVALSEPNGGIQERANLDGIEGANGVTGRQFLVAEQPRLALIDANELTYDPGHVIRNGQRVREPYIAEAPTYSMAPVHLGPREYLMFGDNRNYSDDGHVWGKLGRERFIGRAEIIFWPRFQILHWWLIIALVVIWLAWGLLRRLWDNLRPNRPAPVHEPSPAPEVETTTPVQA